MLAGMGRFLRQAVGGVVYHVLNRRVLRLPLFEDDGDDRAFVRVMSGALQRDDAPSPWAQRVHLLTSCCWDGRKVRHLPHQLTGMQNRNRPDQVGCDGRDGRVQEQAHGRQIVS